MSLDQSEAEKPLLAFFMIKISNNDALGIIKSVLSFLKRNTVLLLIEEVFSLIPFKTWFWHFTIPYSYMGPYNTAALLVNDWTDVGSKAPPKSELQSMSKKKGVGMNWPGFRRHHCNGGVAQPSGTT